jgi:hypothetical protein
LSGEIDQANILSAEKKTANHQAVDPMLTLRAALDDSRYDRVRDLLKDCAFVPEPGTRMSKTLADMQLDKTQLDETH